jgi:hypothetical protein
MIQRNKNNKLILHRYIFKNYKNNLYLIIIKNLYLIIKNQESAKQYIKQDSLL